jgi:hypothetical protein
VIESFQRGERKAFAFRGWWREWPSTNECDAGLDACDRRPGVHRQGGRDLLCHAVAYRVGISATATYLKRPILHVAINRIAPPHAAVQDSRQAAGA